MKMYGSTQSATLCDVEAFHYVQEAQLDKFRQYLEVTLMPTNLAHVNHEASTSHVKFNCS